MLSTYSNSSGDIEATMVGINIIQDRTEVKLNQQSFNAALDVACVYYV